MAYSFSYYPRSQGTPVDPEPEPVEDPEPGYIETLIANHPKHPWRSRPCPECRLAFQRWRARSGAFADDDHAEPLTDDEIDYLARHVLP